MFGPDLQRFLFANRPNKTAALGRAPPWRWRRQDNLNGIVSGLYIHIRIVPLPCQAQVCHARPAVGAHLSGSRGPPVMSDPAAGAG